MFRLTRRFMFVAIGLFTCGLLLLLVIRQSQTTSCNCPTWSKEANSHKELISSLPVRYNTNRLNSCKEIDGNRSVQRAIIIYYPHNQKDYFFAEVRWYVFIHDRIVRECFSSSETLTKQTKAVKCRIEKKSLEMCTKH
jgi:hypothetical protein